MKIVRNKMLPPKGFSAINLFGMLFCKPNTRISDRLFNHESIHTAQMKEMLYIPFYLWYVIEWLIKLFGKDSAYRSISFEREAYTNQDDLNYLKTRKHYCWIKRLFK